MNREEAWSLVQEFCQNPALQRHMRAVEIAMRAYARNLGAEHARAYDYGIDRSASRLNQARQAIERAQALAPDDIEVQIEEGTFYQYGSKDYKRAVQTFEKVLRAAPNNVDARLQLSLRLSACARCRMRPFSRRERGPCTCNSPSPRPRWPGRDGGG